MAECVKTPPIVCCLMQHDSYVKLRYVTVITQKAPMLAHTLLCTAIIAKRRKNPLSGKAPKPLCGILKGL